METHNSGEGFNTGMAAERLKAERAEIMAQIDALVQLSKESGEDIDAPLGSGRVYRSWIHGTGS